MSSAFSSPRSRIRNSSRLLVELFFLPRSLVPPTPFLPVSQSYAVPIRGYVHSGPPVHSSSCVFTLYPLLLNIFVLVCSLPPPFFPASTSRRYVPFFPSCPFVLAAPVRFSVRVQPMRPRCSIPLQLLASTAHFFPIFGPLLQTRSLSPLLHDPIPLLWSASASQSQCCSAEFKHSVEFRRAFIPHSVNALLQSRYLSLRSTASASSCDLRTPPAGIHVVYTGRYPQLSTSIFRLVITTAVAGCGYG
ncbi:hypothetical protein B0H13DRAFT_2373007 [Mycena leptocephala]|nr:hypothetical protein B0H13DRAFT_2373007 [Mycena leptocephala]